MIDKYGREIDYLRISLTDRCNLRCIYCMPEEGVKSLSHAEILTYDEILRICRCAADLGIRQVRVVANKVRSAEDEEFVRSKIPAEDLLGFIHYNTEVIDADRQGKAPYDVRQSATDEIRKIKAILDESK